MTRSCNRDDSSVISETSTASTDVPEEFLCPISLAIMDDPVMSKFGQNYDRHSISEWMGRGHTTCPMTRQPLKPSLLVPNAALEAKIKCWRLQTYGSVDGPTNPGSNDDGNKSIDECYARTDYGFIGIVVANDSSMMQQRRRINDLLSNRSSSSITTTTTTTTGTSDSIPTEISVDETDRLRQRQERFYRNGHVDDDLDDILQMYTEVLELLGAQSGQPVESLRLPEPHDVDRPSEPTSSPEMVPPPTQSPTAKTKTWYRKPLKIFAPKNKAKPSVVRAAALGRS